VGVRKPDTAIYDYLIKVTKVIPRDIIFIDDRPKNLDSAAVFGFSTILFNPTHDDMKDSRHRVAITFNDVALMLTTAT